MLFWRLSLTVSAIFISMMSRRLPSIINRLITKFNGKNAVKHSKTQQHATKHTTIHNKTQRFGEKIQERPRVVNNLRAMLRNHVVFSIPRGANSTLDPWG